MSFETYKKKKVQVLNVLKNIDEKINDDQIKDFVQKKITSLEEDCFKIAVFGHYSVGKSKFLNALMGFKEQILVEDELACTATITRLREAKTPEMINKAEVIYRNGNVEVIDIEDLPKYSARNRKFNVEDNIDEVLLNLDSEYLKNGIEIIDTPGFNSAYAIHTDIAKNFIQKSDASIFLFAADQAGSEVEFEFLNEVNQYINRIFFVMNKIDICRENNESPDEIVADLRDKMIEVGVKVENKVIYPISAKKHHESISEDSEEKRKEGQFKNFTKPLSTYLTGEENIKDRLESPLHSIEKRLQKEKNILEEQLQACNQSQEEIKRELKDKHEEIDNLEKELKEKKRHVKSNVKSIMRNAKSQFEQLVPEIQQETRSLLNDITTEFDIELTDFAGITISVYDKFLNKWNTVRNNIELDLEQLVDEITDSEEAGMEIQEKILDIIHKRLDIEKIETDTPEINLDKIKEIDKELEKKKKEYEESRRQLSELRGKRENHEELIYQRKKIEEEICRLKKRKDLELDTIGNVKPKTAVKTVTKEQQRCGFFGKIGNALFGPKVINKQETYTDYSEVEWAEESKKNIQNQYSIEIKNEESKLRKQLEDIYKLKFDEFEILETEDDVKNAKSRYMNSQVNIYKRKQEMTSKIIKVNVNQFYNQVEQIEREYLNDVHDYLTNNRKVIVHLILELLNMEKNKIEEKRNNLYNMEVIAGKSPEDLEKEVNDIHTKIADIIEMIKYIKKEKELI